MEKDCQACKLNTEDTIGRSRWRKKKLIKNVYGDQDGWEWVVADNVPLKGCVCMRYSPGNVHHSGSFLCRERKTSFL